MTNYERTCLNRFIGRCKDCKQDYSQGHHPNNLDCPNYREMKLVIFEVKEREKNEQVPLQRPQ